MNKAELEGKISSNVGSRWSPNSAQRVSWFQLDMISGNRTDTVFCIAFGEWAKLVRDELQQGMGVHIVGHLQSYVEQVGTVKRQAMQVVIDDLTVLANHVTTEQRLGGGS